MPRADPPAARGRARGKAAPHERTRAEPPPAHLTRPERERRRLAPTRSRLLQLTLVAATGLLAVSGGLALSRSHPGSFWAELLFWIGLALIVVPFAGHLARAGAGRRERIGSLIVVGLLLYLVKVVHDPYGFVYADEWVHVYNAQEIVRTGSLYHANPIISVTSHYPGLETVTAALASTAGLSVFGAGLVVLGVARIVLVLALFLLFERLTNSSRFASIAGLIYVTNPNFLFWSAQFSYESLALPLIAFAAFAAVAMGPAAQKAARAAPGLGSVRRLLGSQRTGWTLVACLAAVTTAATHHISSWALSLFLIAVCLVASLRRSTRSSAPWLVAATAIAAAVLWPTLVAQGTGSYLIPVLRRAIHDSFEAVLGHGPTRSIFQPTVGTHEEVAEPWQRAFAILSVGLILVGLPFGVREIARRYLLNPFVVVLGAAAVAYVAILPLRLVPTAWETSNRSSEFLFVGVALTLALALSTRWVATRVVSRTVALVVAEAVAVLLIGGVEVGWPPRVLLSLPYRVQAGGTPIPTQPAAAADWAGSVLGPGHRFIAPQAVGRELLVHGGQTAFITSSPFAAATVLYGDRLTSGIVDTLGQQSIGFVAIDRRSSGDDGMSGYFFPDRNDRNLSDPVAAAKFDGFPGVDRLLDTGDIVVYDVRRLVGVSG